METKIEYRVRPVTRYIVTSYRESENAAHGSRGHGEFDDEETAYAVGYALAKADHERMGWSIDDERIQYPRRPSEEQILCQADPTLVGSTADLSDTEREKYLALGAERGWQSQ